MKLLISFALLLCMFSASATETTPFATYSNLVSSSVNTYPNPGKGKRQNKRIRKKRKRACSRWGRRSFAG